jgi:electron transfer flavoprotein alpha subunit
VEFQEASAGDVDITQAEFLLSIGRGVEDKDNIPPRRAARPAAGRDALRLVAPGGCRLGPECSADGPVRQDRQAAVYLALGISGAVQHLPGMRNAETIIAVNTDPEAPMFGVAHYGAVADLFEVADELEQALV